MFEIGNSGKVFYFSDHGGDRGAHDAANEWALEQQYNENSPWYVEKGYTGWTMWTLVNTDWEMVAWTINFYK